MLEVASPSFPAIGGIYVVATGEERVKIPINGPNMLLEVFAVEGLGGRTLDVQFL